MSPISNASRLADFGSGIGTQGAIVQIDNVNARVGIGTTNPQAMFQVGTAVTVYGSTGIVSATAFFGDGSGLSNTGAALAEVSGTERLVLTNLTSGTMVSAATTSDVTFNATTDTFHIGTGVTIFGGTSGIVSAISYKGDLTIGTPVSYTHLTLPTILRV